MSKQNRRISKEKRRHAYTDRDMQSVLLPYKQKKCLVQCHRRFINMYNVYFKHVFSCLWTEWKKCQRTKYRIDCASLLSWDWVRSSAPSLKRNFNQFFYALFPEKLQWTPWGPVSLKTWITHCYHQKKTKLILSFHENAQASNSIPLRSNINGVWKYIHLAKFSAPLLKYYIDISKLFFKIV